MRPTRWRPFDSAASKAAPLRVTVGLSLGANESASESKDPPKERNPHRERRAAQPVGTLRFRSLGGCSTQGDMVFVIGSERVRERVEESPEG